MASKAKQPKGVEVAVQTKAPQRFTVERLRANCRALFGVSTSTFDGAAYGMTGQYTVEEMKAHIEKWGKEGVR